MPSDSGQGVFPFYEALPPRPKRPERLFFGVLPDARTSQRVSACGEAFIEAKHLDETRLRAERLHISLRHVGDYKRLPSDVVYAARAAGRAVSMRPFEATLRCIVSFASAPATSDRPRRKRALVLLCEAQGFFQIRSSLGGAMGRNGSGTGDEFTPHMTLSYGWQSVPCKRSSRSATWSMASPSSIARWGSGATTSSTAGPCLAESPTSRGVGRNLESDGARLWPPP